MNTRNAISCRALGALAWTLLLATFAPGAVAQVAGLEQRIESMVRASMPVGAKVSLSIGQLDSRLNLAPCQQAEPFLPPGVRLWGRSSIGIRCIEGARWSVFLPMTVTVVAPAVVAARPLASGVALSATDVVIQEVELTREAGPVVMDPDQLRGQSLSRSIQPGQTIALDALRPVTTIQQGDPVRVMVQGDGFAMTTEGQATASAGEGQTLRVKLDNGKIVVGVLRGRTVRISL
jgi:flagella basal body P-ring formation protein FlgA